VQQIKRNELMRAIVITIKGDYSSVEEIQQLLRTLNIDTVEVLYQKRERPDSRYYVGEGKIGKLLELIDFSGAHMVVVDDELTPVQAKNLEKKLSVVIKDRTQVILDIFAQHATTEEGKLQVEFAKLKYELPRLIGQGKWLSRLGGGTGTRGPGEQKIEEKRRKIRERIVAIKRQLSELAKDRTQQRKMRLNSELPMVSVVGYTNAGKSSLIKIISGSDILIANQLFSTLSPVVRRVKLPSGRVALFKDTVGFIKNVPHTIIEAFKSTLEEILFSDLILLVVDLSDENFQEKLDTSLSVVYELGADEIPRLLVFNKVDLIPYSQRIKILQSYPGAILISAVKADGIRELLSCIDKELEKSEKEALLTFKLQDMSWVLKEREKIVVKEQIFRDNQVIVRIKARSSVLERLRQHSTQEG